MQVRIRTLFFVHYSLVMDLVVPFHTTSCKLFRTSGKHNQHVMHTSSKQHLT